MDLELISYRVDCLIKNATIFELKIKSILEEMGFKFYFQYPVYDENMFYILDFYLPEINSYLELDGKQHSLKEAKIYDKKRKEFIINNFKYKEIRIKNASVFKMTKEKLIELLYPIKLTKNKKQVHNFKKKNNFKMSKKDRLLQNRYDKINNR